MDADGSGSIDVDELGAAFKLLGRLTGFKLLGRLTVITHSISQPDMEDFKPWISVIL